MRLSCERNWAQERRHHTPQKSENEATYKDTRFLRRVPEDVARRADIVLSDLDGNWEDIYVQPKTKLETVVAVFPDGTVPANGGLCKDIERGSVTYEDFFHVSDGKIEFSEQYDAEGNPAGTAVHLFDTTGDHEVARIDRLLPNVIAHPDIMVSRIDTYGIAAEAEAEYCRH